MNRTYNRKMLQIVTYLVDCLTEIRSNETAKTFKLFAKKAASGITNVSRIFFNTFTLQRNYGILKYWDSKNKSDDEIIEEADRLFVKGKYIEVYELLNRLKYAGNEDVQWRIARALFKMSTVSSINIEIRKQMIREAYDILEKFHANNPDSSPDIHKWMAICLDRKNSMDGIEVRMKNSETVKYHLMKCCELNPTDVTAQYLLGRWCYEMSNITWFQRLLGKFLYGTVPSSSYQEAKQYLMNAESLQPKLYLQNTYLLGKTCLQLGQYYRAKYYFTVVSSLPALTDYEKRCVLDAKRILRKLDKYNLDKNVLFYEYPFGNNS